jgi:hypothetical protein
MRPSLRILSLILLVVSTLVSKYGVRWSKLHDFGIQLALAMLAGGFALAWLCAGHIDQLRGVAAASGELRLAQIFLVLGLIVFVWGGWRLASLNLSLPSVALPPRDRHRDFAARLRVELKHRPLDLSRGLGTLAEDLNFLQLLRPRAADMVAALPETHDLLIELDHRIAGLKAAVEGRADHNKPLIARAIRPGPSEPRR